jgi:nucleoside-diphosphate-sugar epimerase
MTTNQTQRVLVTGANGFLGRNVLAALAARPDAIAIAACRKPERLAPGFRGTVRAGNLLDPAYRRDVVKEVDAIIHAGSWASMWGHRTEEHERFFAPTQDLIEQAIGAGVQRFIQASTVAIGAVAKDDTPLDDTWRTAHTGFWPHLDCLVDLDRHMQTHCHRGTQMVTLRLGHFVGAGNRLGMLPALVPRLRTYLVPWLGGGHKRLPLVADTDLGQACALAATAEGLADYESFNICGTAFPTLREVVTFIAAETGFPQPLYSVPYPAGYAFGWLMETLEPILPGSSPFLTRSIVHLCENWNCPSDHAQRKLGYVPRTSWQVAVREHLADLKGEGYPWPRLSQVA